MCVVDSSKWPGYTRQRTASAGSQRSPTNTPVRLPFTAPGEAWLEPTHSVTGNQTRFTKGLVAIELDDEWRRDGESNTTVGALTWPLRLRYGYREGVP